jgi:ATP-binding cassette subfamily B (MDR/TAP) protein 1
MGFATSLEMKNFLGEDIGDDNGKDETTSPGGIIVETLLNMGTVSALNMEEERYKNFEEALSRTDEHYVREGFLQGRWLQSLQ